MNEINIITYKSKKIANHYYDKEGNWLIIWVKEVGELDKAMYKKEIQEMADRNEIKVNFGNEALPPSKE